jgi:hypothetical protein
MRLKEWNETINEIKDMTKILRKIFIIIISCGFEPTKLKKGLLSIEKKKNLIHNK